MNSNFTTPTTQSGFTLGTAAQPATGGFSFEAATTGAGDANKPGLLQSATQQQGKPEGQLFSANFSTPRFGSPATSATGFGSTSSGAPVFGTPASGTSGFSLSQTANPPANLPSSTSATAPTSGMTFRASPATSGFRPSAPSTLNSALGTPNAPSILTFNSVAATVASGTPSTGNISFAGSNANPPGISSGTAPTAGFTGLGFTAAAPTASSLEFNVGLGGTPAAIGATSFGISGAAQSVPSSGPPSAANPTPASSAQGGFTLSGAPTQAAQTTGASFSLGGTATATPAPAAAGFNLAAPASSGSFSLGSTAPTTAAPAFNLGQTTTALSTPGFSLGQTSSVAASTAAPISTAQTSLGTATNVTASTVSASQPTGLNFCQLEESINKWTLELEEQEKAFVNQATQVNAWDRLLIANGEKIVTLNQEVERVKLEQQQLEHELDYVVGQQRELQDCLVPLEKELASVSATDPEREYTYRLAENLDTQLKQMSEDLKEIIEHLNEANRSQDSSDPIVQIGKILNAHMNSLQWLDQRTAVLQTRIQQIDQMHQNFRQEHERSFNLAYN